MREFEFVVRFDRGADELMDVFHEYPSLSSRSSFCVSTARTMWRIDHLKGTADALEAAEEVFLDENRCNECLSLPNCDTYREYHVLDSKAGSRTIYTFRREVHRCHSVPFVVFDHVGPGVVFEARRTDGEYRWKVLYPDRQAIGELYDAIEAELRPGLELDVSHLREAGNWDAGSRAAAQLSHEHWFVLEAAFERGYYSRPREVTVAELSDDLDLPRSTVQYRLRTAEDAIISGFVESSL
ncbi:MAG: helix-turn-helix domain-containing protein [Salinigranum sp.]